MNLSLPLKLDQWIEENRDLLKPPVGNKCIYDDDFIVMAVGGPNQRSDYHHDEGAEFFYQVHGDMVLRIMEDDRPRDITIREGEIFLLPPRVPHSPQRFADTVGLVVERRRLEGEMDGLMWFCPECNHRIYEEYFQLEDIETQFPPVFRRFFDSEAHRTCDKCGTVHPAE